MLRIYGSVLGHDDYYDLIINSIYSLLLVRVISCVCVCALFSHFLVLVFHLASVAFSSCTPC